MDSSEEMSSALDRLYRRLKDEYSRGYDDGVEAGRLEAAQALDYALTAFTPKSPDADQSEYVEGPKQEYFRIRVSVPDDSCLSPGQTKALEWLRAHPGATQQQAYKSGEVGNKNVFYRLEKLGCVRKEGAQFFAVDSAP